MALRTVVSTVDLEDLADDERAEVEAWLGSGAEALIGGGTHCPNGAPHVRGVEFRNQCSRCFTLLKPEEG